MVVTRFLTAPMSFDSIEGGADRLDRRHRRARGPRRADRGARPPTASRRASPAAGCRSRASKAASVDARGSTPYFGAGADGTRYFVKALGDDQRSADLLFRIYRCGAAQGPRRRAAVLLAAPGRRARGLRRPGRPRPRRPHPARRAPSPPPSRTRYVLAYEAVDGQSLDGVPPEEITDEVLGQVWDAARAPPPVPHRPPRPPPGQRLPRRPTAGSG